MKFNTLDYQAGVQLYLTGYLNQQQNNDQAVLKSCRKQLTRVEKTLDTVRQLQPILMFAGDEYEAAGRTFKWCAIRQKAYTALRSLIQREGMKHTEVEVYVARVQHYTKIERIKKQRMIERLNDQLAVKYSQLAKQGPLEREDTMADIEELDEQITDESIQLDVYQYFESAIVQMETYRNHLKEVILEYEKKQTTL